jgi:hypothetical protein
MDRKKNIFDKIGSLIPGYRGYAEREGRRNCDKILREEIAHKLGEVEKILYQKINEAFKQKEKDLMKDIEEVRKEINTLSSKVKFAPHGASAFFTDAQIKENELFHIYQLDLDLAQAIENLRNNVDSSPLSEIKKTLVSCIEILNKRNSYINEFK